MIEKSVIYLFVKLVLMGSHVIFVKILMFLIRMMNVSLARKANTLKAEYAEVKIRIILLNCKLLDCASSIPNCVACADASTCTRCRSQYVLNQNNQCQLSIQSCTKGSFLEDGACKC